MLHCKIHSAPNSNHHVNGADGVWSRISADSQKSPARKELPHLEESPIHTLSISGHKINAVAFCRRMNRDAPSSQSNVNLRHFKRRPVAAISQAPLRAQGWEERQRTAPHAPLYTEAKTTSR
ncbi:hypothetical protein AVEN_216632-1 [Araneus ventricosus]|uniref:Uncharacterized protein n=1 Tax=Araneus ventricosus TaxID=182803 RepID=A0A4Y2DX72_ARAVE|nr:hypothetical protein AVEN_216632-1 [Araneus ventricosus]